MTFSDISQLSILYIVPDSRMNYSSRVVQGKDHAEHVASKTVREDLYIY